jgi:hypothetical protein
VDDAQNACLGMRTGNSGDLEIANPRWGQYSKGEAEIIVYWAITDLCPDQISKRNDQWKTGS